MVVGSIALAGCSDSQEPPGESPAPVLAALSPPEVVAGSGAVTVTATGSSFVPATIIQWNGSARTTTFVSATELRVAIPSADLADPGVVEVSAHTPAPGGGSSAPVQFSVLAPLPTLTSISPSSAVAGDARLNLTLNGAGFTGSSVIRWGDIPLPTTHVGSTRLQADVSQIRLEVDDSVSVVVFNPGPGGGTSNALLFTVAPLIREVGLQTNELIFHPGSGLIYASVPSTGGAWANSLAVIDPETGSILRAIPIGSEPGKLALSDDGTVLYIALNGTGEVRRFNVTTETPGMTFSLGDGNLGTRYAEDLAVFPGAPQSVAVSMRFATGISPRHAGLAVFDNGVMRGDPTGEHSGPNAIEFSASSSTLYGLHNETDDGGFYTVAIGAGGPTVADVTSGLILGTSDIAFAAGRAYGTTGAIVDPVALQLLGTFAVNEVGIYGSRIVVDAANSRAVFLEAGDPPFSAALHAFDLNSFQSIRTLRIPAAPGPSDATSLIRWGADGLAFRSLNIVYLVRSRLVRH
jgi:trimeric autotransporter adhesin